MRERCPLLASALPYVGHPVIRNRGTIGGTLAHADRVAELTAVALALDAVFVALGPEGHRNIPAHEFFVDDLTTALMPGEMLREVRLPIATPGCRAIFVEATNRHHDLAIVGIAVQLKMSDGVCTAAHLAANGIGPIPVRLSASEERLAGAALDDTTIRECAALSIEGLEIADDLHAPAEYRKIVTPRLLDRALHLVRAEHRELS